MAIQADVSPMGPNPWIILNSPDPTLRRLSHARRRQTEAVFGRGAQLKQNFSGPVEQAVEGVPEKEVLAPTTATKPSGPGTVGQIGTALQELGPENYQKILDWQRLQQAGGEYGMKLRIQKDPALRAKYTQIGNLEKQDQLGTAWNEPAPIENLAEVGRVVGANIIQDEMGFHLTLPDGRKSLLDQPGLDRFYRRKRVEEIQAQDPIELALRGVGPQLPMLPREKGNLIHVAGNVFVHARTGEKVVVRLSPEELQGVEDLTPGAARIVNTDQGQKEIVRDKEGNRILRLIPGGEKVAKPADVTAHVDTQTLQQTDAITKETYNVETHTVHYWDKDNPGDVTKRGAFPLSTSTRPAEPVHLEYSVDEKNNIWERTIQGGRILSQTRYPEGKVPSQLVGQLSELRLWKEEPPITIDMQYEMGKDKDGKLVMGYGTRVWYSRTNKKTGERQGLGYQQFDGKGNLVASTPGAAGPAVPGAAPSVPAAAAPHEQPLTGALPHGQGQEATKETGIQAIRWLEANGLPVTPENVRSVLAKSGWTAR
jgi:hypothetical protein